MKKHIKKPTRPSGERAPVRQGAGPARQTAGAQPHICLNMIVKNEARVIERCLSSVKPFINHWVIVDTGSTDGTQDIIRRFMRGVPGTLHERPWRNFGHNRTEALNLARDQADYLLFIDADEQLGVLPGRKLAPLTEAAYSLETRFGNTVYDRVALVATRLPWSWKGVLHEYLDAGQPVPQPRLPGAWIQVTPDGARSQDPKKFEKDAAALEAALLLEPDNCRYVFYLAQSYRDAGQLDKARETYRRRAAMGGWDEEVWYALYEIGKLTEQLGGSPAEVRNAYLEAYQARPSRAEPLFQLARYHRERQEWALAHLAAQQAVRLPMSKDRLFVDTAVYAWRCLDELGIAAFYLQDHATGRKAIEKLLAEQRFPADQRARIENNLRFFPATA